MPDQFQKFDPALMLRVLTAMRDGDFSVRLPAEWTGLDGKIADTFNEIIAQSERMATEMAEACRVVGTEGKLGRRIQIPGARGGWKLKVDSVNTLIEDLAQPIRETGRVIGAVARGVLTETLELDVEGRPLLGEFLKNARTINTMVDQLNAFASEVTRVAREVGTEGKLGGQAQVAGVDGVWKELTDNVNLMAGNLTTQVRSIAEVTTAVARGDLSRKITVDVRGEILELKNTINTMVDQLNAFAGEVTRVAREVGTEGRLGGQAYVPAVAGVWKDLTDNVNLMAGNLTAQVRNIAAVTTAVANGDLSRKISVDVKGELAELKDTINTMVDQLNAFASEVTRVAREVGTEGRLGGQAQVQGVSGTWKDLTDSVNLMADNLTDQVRGIARVVTAVAAGDLRRKMTVPAKGEIAALADTVNAMVDTLAIFSDQVTRVAREVGVEGRLGGQATVPGADGSWKDLVDNVNELAANLSGQVRAIGEVATAVTKGDLTRFIQVAAAGEVAALKDNVNQMIRNLRDTTQRNEEQNWLKTNLARLTRLLQGQRDIPTVARELLSELSPLVAAQHGVFYLMQPNARLKLLASYGLGERKHLANEWALGEGLVGQAAYEKQRILLTQVPPDYVRIVSGLGEAPPLNIILLPILFEGQVKAVIELASLERFQPIHQAFLDQLADGLGIVLSSIESAASTEALLRKSQALAGELKAQQDELTQTNRELEQKARQLAEQNVEVERKNREIDEARLTLQEKAEQLALTSKYKSEFLANMSHELRTPLNSLLLLAEQLGGNPGGNMTDSQVEMIQVIHGAGSELLRLINDILDLSKIESGSISLEIEQVPFAELAQDMDRTFRHLAQAKGLEFDLRFAPELPAALDTDSQRLRQVLRNLLSNAIKFTDHGRVSLEVTPATEGWSADHPQLDGARRVVAFAVTDTGIGIPRSKQKLVFEAFQQAEAGTARRYGGTGLGLAISREIATLLGGEIRVESEEGVGSRFTLYMPVRTEAGARPTGPTLVKRPPARQAVADDRERIEPGDGVVLIVEDDANFARLLVDMAHRYGFKALVAAAGRQALELAERHVPDAVTLDLGLDDMDGWAVLDELKRRPRTRDVPVHVLTVRDRPPQQAQHGAASYMTKPVDMARLAQMFARIRSESTHDGHTVLVLTSDPELQARLVAELEQVGLSASTASTVEEAVRILTERNCLGLVLGEPPAEALDKLEALRGHEPPLRQPAFYYAPVRPSAEEQLRLARLQATVLVEGEQSLEQLRADLEDFLQHLQLNGDRQASEPVAAPSEPSPQPSPQPSAQAPAQEGELRGRTALVVDDDARNLFALTGLLESHGMEVITAEGGAEAIAALEQAEHVDVVLMDIMMPEMDGYEATRRIRAQPRFQRLPIIALTAKAMKGDREKCLEAGASDYISKPVASHSLLELLRRWLAEGDGEGQEAL